MHRRRIFRCPSTLGTPSSLTGEAPTAWPAGGRRRSRRLEVRSAMRRHHRIDDLAVARAAAQDAAERVLHLFLARVRIAFEERGGGDQHARRADAALGRAMARGTTPAAPTAGHRPSPSTVRTVRTFDRRGRHQAGADRLAVEQDRAGAAIAGVAADLGAGQPEFVAQDRRQPSHRRDRNRHRRAVHDEAERREVGFHAAARFCGSPAACTRARVTISRAASRR